MRNTGAAGYHGNSACNPVQHTSLNLELDTTAPACSAAVMWLFYSFLIDFNRFQVLYINRCEASRSLSQCNSISGHHLIHSIRLGYILLVKVHVSATLPRAEGCDGTQTPQQWWKVTKYVWGVHLQKIKYKRHFLQWINQHKFDWFSPECTIKKDMI